MMETDVVHLSFVALGIKHTATGRYSTDWAATHDITAMSGMTPAGTSGAPLLESKIGVGVPNVAST